MGPKGSLQTGYLAVVVTFPPSPLQGPSFSPSKTDNCITFPTSPDADPVLHVCRHTSFRSSQLLPLKLFLWTGGRLLLIFADWTNSGHFSSFALFSCFTWRHPRLARLTFLLTHRLTDVRICIYACCITSVTCSFSKMYATTKFLKVNIVHPALAKGVFLSWPPPFRLGFRSH